MDMHILPIKKKAMVKYVPYHVAFYILTSYFYDFENNKNN
jgi:hypothetical protein